MNIFEELAIAGDHHRAGRLDLAEQIYRRILQADPTHAEALELLGVIAHQRGHHEEAVRLIQTAIQADPARPEFFNNLGEAYRALGRNAEAAASLRQALALRPDDARAHYNLGLVSQGQGDADQAAGCYRRAIELNSNLPKAHNNLGILLSERGKLDEGIACFQQALRLQPGYVGALSNLGSARHEQGDAGEALACFSRALEIAPDDAAIHSNLLLMLHYRPGVTPADLLVAHAEYQRRHALGLQAAWRRHENRRDPQRTLRLGLVSPDLDRHPVGYFLVRAIENLDRRQFEVVCYSDLVLADEITARFKAASAAWRDTRLLSDEQLAGLVRDDQIDVLFDLAGHTGENRLLMFARKPAPIQITWAAYAGTTGLEAMDYLLADGREVPPGCEAHYRERVLRLPDGYVCFDPPADAPAVGPLPALGGGPFTFGSFAHPAKISATIAGVWAEILRRVPNSRLLLKYRGLDSSAGQERLRSLLAASGVAPERLELLGGSPHAGMLAAYNQVDVALDTFPYSGGLTTCEALWMGVPEVTCPGETFAGRHSLSHMTAAGFTETIAGDLHQYADMAVALAGNLPRLAEVRAGLRGRVARSPLCDGKRFAENLAEILFRVWREWLQSGDY